MTKKQNKVTVSAYSVLLIGVMAAILSIPLFIFFYKYFPAIEINLKNNIIRLDHVILFLGLFFILYYLLKKLRIIVLIVALMGVILLTVTNFMNIYTLENLYHDYSTFLFDLSNNSLKQKFFIRELKFFKNDLLKEAVDYNKPEVRNYAANIASANFDTTKNLSSQLKWVHFFSIFKEINRRWNYVYDPKNEDYYASASETIEQLNFDDKFKGDCDDHSILMAACIKAVGGEVRLVKTKVKLNNGETVGHMYPEVKFGDVKDLEAVVYLLKNIYFQDETKNKNIHYYQDLKGFIWLNFDYNDNYPGGKYQSDIREAEIEV